MSRKAAVQREGPLLEVLTRRLAECPAEFLAEPRFGNTGVIQVAAVVSDLLRDLGGAPLSKEDATPFVGNDKKKDRNRLRCTLVTCWLLHDAWFREEQSFADAAKTFLTTGMQDLAALISAPQLVSDPDRREELVRLTLQALDLRPKDETIPQAQDRLTTLSSIERQRVIREAQAAEERARQIREAMARQAAEEAAARYTRE